MSLASPIWLWLGLALVVPVLIHLWNRRSGAPRLLGTFRFLPEDTFASARRIELHEIPLLLIRMGIVVLVILLLSDLLWKGKEIYPEQVSIIQKEKESSTRTEDEQGNPVVHISSEELATKGWWNILAQLDHEYQPDRIVAHGAFMESFFKGNRPGLRATVEWQPADSLITNSSESEKWRSGNESWKLIQERSNTGIKTEILPADMGNADYIRVMLNPENSPEQNAGFRYAAGIWKLETEEQAMEAILQLEAGEQAYTLIHSASEEGSERGIVPANAITGIPLEISNMDTTLSAESTVLATTDPRTPFLAVSGSEWILNGAIPDNLESWVYAGVLHQMIARALQSGPVLSPVMEMHQRDVIKAETLGSSSRKSQSARFWLFGALAILWLAERWLAPKRGM